MIGLDTHDYRGLLQRVFALTVFVPIGVGAYVLARRTNAAPAGPGKPHGAVPAASPIGEEW
jgi:hypothetical protein